VRKTMHSWSVEMLVLFQMQTLLRTSEQAGRWSYRTVYPVSLQLRRIDAMLREPATIHLY